MENALFELILQCVSRYTATRLGYSSRFNGEVLCLVTLVANNSTVLVSSVH